MQIISHMTNGNQFLSRGISFSLRKPTRGTDISETTAEFTHFAFSQESCRSTPHRPFLFTESGFLATGKYRNTLINIMYSQSLIVLQTDQIAYLF